MSKKRFTDIEIWDKEWYMELKPVYKCLIKYMFDKCDAAGCWKPNWKLASLHINEPVEFADLAKLPKDQYEILKSGKIFIPDFINFQYGQLSEKSPAHKPIFAAIEKNNLSNRVFNRVSDTLLEKDMEKDKEKEEEKDKEKEAQKYLIPEMQKIWKKYKTDYPIDKFKDVPALQSIAVFICEQTGINYYARGGKDMKTLYELWDTISKNVASHSFFKNYSLQQVEKHIQNITQTIKNGTSENSKTGTGKINGEQINKAFTSFHSQAKHSGDK